MSATLKRLDDAKCALIRVAFKGKAPLSKEWQKRTCNDNDLNEFHESCNIGIVLGLASNNIVDVDLDNEIARQLAPHFLPPTGWIFGRPTTPKSHYLYRIDGDAGGTRKFATSSCILEYRANGSQTVVPPSTHVEGESIDWDTFDEPGVTTRDYLLHRQSLLATATLLVEHFVEGKRQDIALAFTGAMLKWCFDVADITSVLEAVCFYTGDNEVTQRADAIQRTVDKFQTNQPFTQETRLAELIGPQVLSHIKKFLNIETPISAVDRLSSIKRF